jgi:PKD repeat protein
MLTSPSARCTSANIFRWLTALILLPLLYTTSVFAGQASLAWDRSTSTNVGGYRLYYGQASQNYMANVDVGNTTNYTLSSLQDGKTYYFAVKAYDTAKTTESGFSNEVSKTVAATVALKADFTSNTTSGTAPLAVGFDASASTGDISSWSWNFGDGSTGTGKTALKSYSTPGTYSVSLTVSGSSGSNTVTKSNLITVTSTAPAANFSATPTAGTAPLTVNFTDTSTGSVTSWSWDFGDGSGSTSRNPSHSYSAPGTYTVKLTATGSGGSNTKTQTGFITVSAPVTDPGTDPSETKAGLVAAYGFDETSGTQADDGSGNANHGVLSGATRVAQGKFSQALSFDGVNDWVTVNDSSSLDLTTGMTLEAWVYPTATLVTWPTVVMKEQTGLMTYALYGHSDTGNPSGYIATSTEVGAHGGSKPALNTWTHLATTYDGANLKVYVNGTQVASQAVSGAISVSSGALRIGGNAVWGGEYFAGRIDEVRIYNRALTVSEIQSDMATAVADDTSTEPEPALVEAGEVEVDHNWKRVTFTKSFTDPVVVAGALGLKDSAPATVRIRNVDNKGFELRVQEWDYLDGPHGLEKVGYLVMEKGSHTLDDGTRVEAGRLTTNATSFKTATFGQAFPSAPVVMAAVTSANEKDAVVMRMRNISTTGFQYHLQEQERNTQTHANETVSYIAWQVSAGEAEGMTYEVKRTGRVVGDKFYALSFQEMHGDAPVFLADMQTKNGGDTANLRWRNKSLFSVEVNVAEEQSKDSEVSHTTEVVGYMVFSPLP